MAADERTAARVCSVDGCGRKHESRGLCDAHYQRLRKHGEVRADVPIKVFRSDCSIDGCERKHMARGYCQKHYRAFKLYGDPLADFTRRHVTQHGTYNEYQNYGCRCDECRRANTAYAVAQSHRVGRHRPHAVVAAERREVADSRHGTQARYKRGCRCDLCRAASAAARRAHRQANREATRAYDRARKRGVRAAA